MIIAMGKTIIKGIRQSSSSLYFITVLRGI